MRVISIDEIQYIAGGGDANGCTAVPNKPNGYDFKPACDNHDFNYSRTTDQTRSQADQKFLNDMLSICETRYNNENTCRATAYSYYIGVRIFGGLFYEGATFGGSNTW